jgi:fructosamine-3-kinase
MEKFQEIIDILKVNNICNKVLKKPSPVSGGCINIAIKLSTDSGDFFVKVSKIEKN